MGHYLIRAYFSQKGSNERQLITKTENQRGFDDNLIETRLMFITMSYQYKPNESEYSPFSFSTVPKDELDLSQPCCILRNATIGDIIGDITIYLHWIDDQSLSTFAELLFSKE